MGANLQVKSQYCVKCGTNLPEYTERFCPECGASITPQARTVHQMPMRVVPESRPYAVQAQPAYQGVGSQAAYRYSALPHVPSHMGWAITGLCFGFLPTAIAAIVHAGQVATKLAVGDVVGARESARKAKIWCWVSFGVPAGLLVIAGLAVLAGL
jgi:predicted RNA-binding Zn-ribbon protein involved in translation (DUF1610 family)